MKKYPRTLHLPFSPEVHYDDKTQFDLSGILNCEVWITEKLDGGNACWHGNSIFARSHAVEAKHASFNYLKSQHQARIHLLNPDYQYFFENTYAIHSIEYTQMKDWYYALMIYDTKKGLWLSWRDFISECERIQVPVVPTLWRTIFTEEWQILDWIKKHHLGKPSMLGGEREGFVIRCALSFPNSEFQRRVLKYVRKGHVQSDEHWTRKWKPQKRIS